RQVLFDPTCGVDEVDCVVIVLFTARADSENVRIKNNVLRRKSNLLRQQVVSAFADLGLPLEHVRLAALVECHHDHCCSIAADESRLLQKLWLPFLKADRINYALALNA